jgi:hypothetical protein
MVEISLTEFVDFATTRTITAQVTKVKDIFTSRPYDPKADFWKIMRDRLQEVERGKRSMESVCSGLSDPKKVNRYPLAVSGYERFQKRSDAKPFRTPSWIWRFQDLIVKIKPDAGYDIEGKKYVVKWYFREATLTALRRKFTFALFTAAMPPDTTAIPAILDIPAGKLHPAPIPPVSLDLELRAAGRSFAQIWNDLEAQSFVRRAKGA